MTSIAPRLLLSMPQLLDPNFARTVVLLCEHGPEGAFGLVLNRPTDVPASSVVGLVPAVTSDNGMRLWIGGPVEAHRGWILLAEEPPGVETQRIVNGLYLSTSPQLLREMLETTPAPQARVLAGYAGWGPGQLEREIGEGSWILGPADPRLVLDRAPEQIWLDSLNAIGIDPAAIVPGSDEES